MRTLLAPFYTIYAYLVIALLWLGHVPITALLLKVEQRRWLARNAMRSAFRLMGVPIRITGQENLPETPCIVVANHGSYLDGPLMNALLPERFAFVIKAEARQTPVAGWYLARLGSVFIDRSNPWAAGKGGNELFDAALRGQCMGIFPEGGFSHEHQLKRFKPGAFVAATRAGLPIVPVAINGTREIMHPDRKTLWPGSIHAHFLPALQPQGNDRETSEALRKSAQASIQGQLEGDLAS